MNSNKKSACGTATATSTMNNKIDLIISSVAKKIKCAVEKIKDIEKEKM